jgi:hypothetical protein
MSTYRTELDNGKTIHKKSATATPAGWHSCRDSSHLGKFLYLPEEQTLLMKFKNNSVYEWTGISKQVWEGLIRADANDESVGEYFHRHVANGKHKSKQLL